MSAIWDDLSVLWDDPHTTWDGLNPSTSSECINPGRLNEWDLWITPDGKQFDLHAPAVRVVQSDTGTGIPPLQMITQRGPYQHGVTLKGIFLQPRVVQMLIRQNGVSRTDWYRIKTLLMDALRPNRTPSGALLPKLGSLKKFMPNGSSIQIDCIVQKGPVFEARSLDTWDEWAITETIQFFCPDPTYYNPTPTQVSFSQPVSQLVFPATWPIVFGALDATAYVAYAGDWPTFPTVVFNGPLTGASIRNLSTNELLSLDFAIPAGTSATFTLPYGDKKVTLSDGTNLVPYLTSDSSMATFHIAPDPEVPEGINALHAYGVNGTVDSSISISWLDRYIGLEILNVTGSRLV